MEHYENVETITLINIKNNKQHRGYWLPIAGFVGGGTYVSLCSNKRSAAHALIPISSVNNTCTSKCTKCYSDK